jgi:hypothetical protein
LPERLRLGCPTGACIFVVGALGAAAGETTVSEQPVRTVITTMLATTTQ